MHSIALKSFDDTPVLATDSPMEIDGPYDGHLGGRQITVLEGALIEGDVDAETVVIHGHVRGKVRALSIDLGPTACVEGELHYGDLMVAPGARIEARCVPS